MDVIPAGQSAKALFCLCGKILRSPRETEFKARNDFQMPQALENEGFREELVKKQVTTRRNVCENLLKSISEREIRKHDL